MSKIFLFGLFPHQRDFCVFFRFFQKTYAEKFSLYKCKMHFRIKQFQLPCLFKLNSCVLHCPPYFLSLFPSLPPFSLSVVQSCNSDMTVVAFLIFPARTNNFNVESLRGQAIAKQLKDTVSSVQSQIGRRLFDICLRCESLYTIYHQGCEFSNMWQEIRLFLVYN